ncbi:snoRNA-binding protein [Tyrophagus putrescentiae]|nr:snoRNA-binding protein [Tyrophagus putrescentiae]
MGKRSLAAVNGEEEVVAQQQQTPGKKSKKIKVEAADETLDETIITEENGGENGETAANGGQPKTRRDLMELPYDTKLSFVSVIANPMANKKLGKKLFKLMRKAGKVSRKTLLRIGLKDVQLRIRKGEKGIVVFAGDVTPIEIMCHLPAVCEEKEIPYIYVPFRTDISTAIGIRRPALMVLIKKHDDFAELYDECEAKIKEQSSPA